MQTHVVLIRSIFAIAELYGVHILPHVLRVALYLGNCYTMGRIWYGAAATMRFRDDRGVLYGTRIEAMWICCLSQ